MRAEELRIGNIVVYEATYHVITELHRDRVFHNWQGADDYFSSYERIEPVPLTEDWLNKFGFKAQEIMDADRYTKTKHFYIQNFQVEFWENSVCGENVFVYNEAQTILVSHVHSLQNLYYSLCGEELKLN